MLKSLEENAAGIGTFGEGLRRERELRDISLDEIAATTKIGTRLLRALEEEQFDLLPGGIFNKGYVRAYAKYVGLDEDKAIADYLQAAHRAASVSHAVAEPTLSGRFESSRLEGSRSSLLLVPVLIVLVLAASIAGGWRLYSKRQLRRQKQVAITDTRNTPQHDSTLGIPVTSVSTSEKSPAAPQADTDNPATATSNTASSGAGTPFQLTVRPIGRAWVSIKCDGKFVVHGIIKPPEVKMVRAHSQVVFWTGNVGAVQVSFNGKNVPLTGGKNEERVLVFNSGGLLPPSAAQ